jgi:UDP-2-acetamido-2-deoxy-ribo-hexuluronate aminotransferase
LQKENIPTAVHYPKSLHQQPIFQELYPENKSFPMSEAAASRVLSLPFHPYLTEGDMDKVVEQLKKYFSN